MRPAAKSVPKDGAAPGPISTCSDCRNFESSMRNDVIGKIFERRSFSDLNACFLNGGLRKRAVNAGGGRSRQTDTRTGFQDDLR